MRVCKENESNNQKNLSELDTLASMTSLGYVCLKDFYRLSICCKDLYQITVQDPNSFSWEVLMVVTAPPKFWDYASKRSTAVAKPLPSKRLELKRYVTFQKQVQLADGKSWSLSDFFKYWGLLENKQGLESKFETIR